MLFKNELNSNRMHYLLRYGEIALKGANRKDFEAVLKRNIGRHLKQQDVTGKITRIPGRFLVECSSEVSFRPVFGLVSASKVEVVEMNMDSMNELALKLSLLHKAKTFRVDANRLDKRCTLESMQVNKEVGAYLVEKTGMKVQLKGSELTVGIELLPEKAFLYVETEACLGGLPVGSQGKIGALIEDEQSVLAMVLVMRRGSAVIPFMKKQLALDEVQQYAPYDVQPVLLDGRDVSEVLGEEDVDVLVVNDVGADVREELSGITLLRPLVGCNKKELAQLKKVYL